MILGLEAVFDTENLLKLVTLEGHQMRNCHRLGLFLVARLFFTPNAHAIIDADRKIQPAPTHFENLGSLKTFSINFCEGFLRNYLKPPVTDPRYIKAILDKRDANKTILASRAAAYLLAESEYQWSWNIPSGRVKIKIAPNSMRYNSRLSDLSGILALLTEGYAGDNHWQPSYSMPKTRTRPSFRVGVETSAGALTALSAAGPEEHILVQEASMTVADGPIDRFSVQIFGTADGLYNYADRLAYLMIESSFGWLEIKWTPEQLKILKWRLHRALSEARP